MGANRGASRLSPSLAYATGITNAYVKCAGDDVSIVCPPNIFSELAKAYGCLLD